MMLVEPSPLTPSILFPLTSAQFASLEWCSAVAFQLSFELELAIACVSRYFSHPFQSSVSLEILGINPSF